MYTVLPYNATTDEAYAVLVDIHNAAWPDELGTVASWRFHDNSWPQEKLRQRFVVESDGQLVTEGVYMQPLLD